MSSRTSAPSTAAMRVIIVESSQRNAVWLGVSGSSVAPGSLMRGERATGVVTTAGTGEGSKQWLSVKHPPSLDVGRDIGLWEAPLVGSNRLHSYGSKQRSLPPCAAPCPSM